ncbi:MAG TPA: hypothetical protein VFK69_02105 [Candidatus Eisenbacteria bacterium]|nr:hypothetical protein [Candidatus Eisenbacteria bacterium]
MTADAARTAVLADIARRIPGRQNPTRRLLWFALMAVGVLSFVFLLWKEPVRAWGTFGANMVFFEGVSIGAAVLACSIRLGNGRWAGPVTRIAEGLSSYLPYGLGALLVMLIAGIWTYLPWTHHVLERQRPYLNVPFLWVRTLAGFGLLWWLITRLVRVSLRRDAWLLRDHVAPELRPHYEKLAANWRGDDAEATLERNQLAMLSPQIVVAFAFVFTVFAWDFIMALSPSWASGLFGWWVFMGAYLNGICMTAFIAVQLRARRGLEAWITPNHFWDIGKLIFGFSIFWVYEFWAQYLVIWYANIPDESWWVFLRFEQPWRPIAFAVFIMVFALPFLGLMNMYTKKSPVWLTAFAVVIMAGMWLERHLLVMPSFSPNHLWIGLPEIGVMLGFLGMFGFAVSGFFARWPAVRVTDVLAGEGAHGH